MDWSVLLSFLYMADVRFSCQNWGLSSDFFLGEADVNRKNFIINSVSNCLPRLFYLGINPLEQGNAYMTFTNIFNGGPKESLEVKLKDNLLSP